MPGGWCSRSWSPSLPRAPTAALPQTSRSRKKTFEFQATLEVGDTAASISVGPDLDDQQIVYQPVNVACGLAG